jgi:ADP-heptose:LPS heptosyltransferase
MFATDSPRILIARMSAIGDTILTLPVACALRDHFPHAYLAWVVERKSAVIVQGHSCLDEVVVLERGWFAKPRSIWAVRRRLWPRHFDVAIDCQSMTKTALACWLSGVRWRIGLRGEHGRELSPWLNNELVRPRRPHVVDRSLELLEPLGIRNPQVAWRLPIDEGARERMRRAVACLGSPHGYAVVNPGATWESRLWEWDRFGRVARHLGERWQLPVLVVWGSSREREWAQQIVAASGGHAVLAPPLTLLELAALIEGGRLMITADTGPLHLAVAVGTPSVALHGTTRPQDSGPYGPPHVAIQVEYHPGSHKERRAADNRAMRLITVEMVCTQCDAVLERTAPAARRAAG